MTDLTSAEIEELKRLEKAAHDETWEMQGPDYDSPNIWIISPSNSAIAKIEAANHSDNIDDDEILTDFDFAAAEYIVAACNALPRLLQMVEALVKERDDDKELSRIMAMSGDELRAEIIAGGEDPDKVVADTRAVIQKAIASANYQRGLRAGIEAAAKVANYEHAGMVAYGDVDERGIAMAKHIEEQICALLEK